MLGCESAVVNWNQPSLRVPYLFLDYPPLSVWLDFANLPSAPHFLFLSGFQGILTEVLSPLLPRVRSSRVRTCKRKNTIDVLALGRLTQSFFSIAFFFSLIVSYSFCVDTFLPSESSPVLLRFFGNRIDRARAIERR